MIRKIQANTTELRQIAKTQSALLGNCPTNENFATGIVKIAEKDPKGIWHNVYVNLRIFNPTEVIQENIDYTMVGSLGVYPACKQFPEKLVINVKTIERTQ